MKFMSEKEWRKLSALEQVVDGDWTMAMGAKAAGLSVRQFRRLRRTFESAEEKPDVVVHGNTGRRPSNRLTEAVVQKILKLRKDKYVDFNDSHFTNKLVEVHKMNVSRPSVQRLLRSRTIASPRARKAKKRRKRRERRSRAGWMVLWDGSIHDWLEGRGPPMCLMGAIDDATGKILRGAHFVDRECSAAYLRVLYDMARHHGVPLEIYADKHSSLRRNDDHWSVEEQLAGRQEPPQVQRAAESLGIEIIWANSPQAKGRIERAWGTFQDRLVSELRLGKVSTIDEANTVLEQYRRDHNRRFSRQPKDRRPAWRKPAKGTGLAEICGFHTTAKIRNDSTFSYQGQIIDVKRRSRKSIAGQTADVRQLLNGELRVYLSDERIHTVKLSPPTKAPKRRRRSASSLKQKAPRKGKTFEQIAAKYRSPPEMEADCLGYD